MMLQVLWWNLSNTDTIGPLKCVLIREVSSFQRSPLGWGPLYFHLMDTSADSDYNQPCSRVACVRQALAHPNWYVTSHTIPWLLFISLRNFLRLLFKSGYYLRVAFIKLSRHRWDRRWRIQLPQGRWCGCRRQGVNPKRHCYACHCELEESDPFADVEGNEDELEEF